MYTLANGVQPAWAAHLYCPSMVEVLFQMKYILRLALGFTACQTDYHNNFSVCDGGRTYHREIPHYVQVGEHQFIEQTVVRMWINEMLIGWSTQYLIMISLTLMCSKSGSLHQTQQNYTSCP